jgi:apolipoprotein N-acyltransferase
MAAFWTVYEFIKSTGYLAYPWGLIPYPIHEWLPLLQFVDIAGIWPLSFLMALSNALFAELLLLGPFGPLKSFRVFQRQGLFFVSLLSLFLVYGILRMSMHPPVLGTLKTVLVQQNTDPWIDDSGGKNLMQAQALSRDGVKKLGGKADLIVWSESSLSRPYADSLSYYERYPRGDPFVGFVREMGTFVLVGTPIVRDRQLRLIQNGVVLLNSQAEIVDSYGKRHPVPIAENVPFWEYEPVRKFFQNVIGLGGIWDLGNRDTIFSVFTSKGEKISFGVPICFEDAFPYICGRFVKKGADLLVNITNDSWSRQNSAQVQHFVAARFRSIELKRVLVRSTNGGLTAVIGPFGEIMAELPMFTPQFLAVEIPVYKEDRMTPYALFGDYLPILLAAILTVLLLYDVLLALITKKNRR